MVGGGQTPGAGWPGAPPQGPSFAPAPQPPRQDRLRHVPLLGTLLAIHGGLMLLWAAFCVFGASVGLLNHALVHRDDWQTKFTLVAYTVFAIGALPAGVLQLVGGVLVRRTRGRMVALVSLWVGVAAFLLGAVFCFPTAVAIMIFGMIVLTDGAVVAKFKGARNA